MNFVNISKRSETAKILFFQILVLTKFFPVSIVKNTNGLSETNKNAV